MWLLISTFIIITLLIGWLLFGYFLYMFFRGISNRKKTAPGLPAKLPKMTIVVPCIDEEKEINEKLDDLLQLDYPQDKYGVIFVDGGSSDGTLKIINDRIKNKRNYRILNCPQKGKIIQLNHAFNEADCDIIVCSDVDGLLEKDALKWIAAEFNSGPEIQVVGAYCYPVNTIEIEHYYWSAQNKGRFIETDARTSPIVIGQCYAFRKGLIDRFPEDAAGDDVYIACYANYLGYKTVYSRHAKACETRTPKNLKEFISHKFRKSNAFLREFLRFTYFIPQMKGLFRLIFIVKFAQQLLLPWSLVLWLLLAVAVFYFLGYNLIIYSICFLFILFIVTSRVFASVELPGENKKFRIFTMIKGNFITILIMLATGISYPFYSSLGKYKKIN
ncbi:MAG: glycosyltransferase [Endomicrobiales bacterium]|nr:glycosyltransferase [Endomicrobiales bacterium]